MQKFSQTPDFMRLVNLFAPRSPPGFSIGDIGRLLDGSIRQRREWNDRFTHWERPESSSETIRIERARDMVRDALSTNTWLLSEGVALRSQGSFTNRTNVRNDADIDLRVEHPFLVSHYEDENDRRISDILGAWFPPRTSAPVIASRLRREITGTLRKAFGSALVDSSGTKAIRVRGVAGSRGEVDVVPSFRFQLHRSSRYGWIDKVVNGSALLAPDGEWSVNFAELHTANGRWKRTCTGHQFKRVVRIIKRLQMDMMARGIVTERIPSFVIESLVYLVEDHVFTDAEDRYGRVRAVLARALSLLTSNGVSSPYLLRDVSGVKLLFGTWQKCTPHAAAQFVAAALAHLGHC